MPPDGVTITFPPEELERAKRAIADRTSALRQRVARTCARYAIRVETKAKENLASDPRRIDEGTLRNSIHHRGSDVSWDVYTALEYAAFVHWGTGIHGENPAGGHRQTPWIYYDEKRKRFVTTSGMRPNKFLLDAMNHYREDFIRDIRADLQAP